MLRLVQQFSPADNFLKNTVIITSSNENIAIREKLFSKLGDDPLLRFRLFEISESFRSKKKIAKTIQNHRERVKWHIQRIYTNRNEIVHSASSLPYLGTLVENLHAYTDTLFESIITLANISSNLLTIDSAIGILSVHEAGYLKYLSGDDEECTNAICIDMIFGKDNPLSPI